MPVDRRRLARGVLAVDGAGCALAAAVILGSDQVLGNIDPSLRSRMPVALALGATSVALLAGAAHQQPRATDLARAAVINAGWVATCALALLRNPSPNGAALLTATAVLDGAAGLAQWRLRPRGVGRLGTDEDER